ncbi:phosphatase PAP2 family protein [Anaerococcus sp. AGMB00486]|uniref:Phosphatase PAP2 family protein n=2 Tax=Anaerococcus TaxID=165779 RepID=A0ABX2N8M6_9FIRM|nr:MULTISPECIES: phosphatase PAP2 family protein [Anaerococcus]MSS77202.1 phosphatase PAP2 family protein [Anaerococcus porci]NVF10993.1 phosphatase PAP2 family protein [Anaerococcus faecalis]
MGFITKIDISILNFIQNTLKSPLLDNLMTSITALGNMGIFWILLILIFLTTKEYKNIGKIMIFSLIVNTIIVNLILKPLFDRARPFEIVDGIKLLILKPTDPSFPSGHAAISFCMLTVILLFSKSKTINIMATILTFLIAFSRLYLYVHYPSDVIVGSILGITCAILGIKFYYSRNAKEIRVKLRKLYKDIKDFRKL